MSEGSNENEYGLEGAALHWTEYWHITAGSFVWIKMISFSGAKYS